MAHYGFYEFFPVDFESKTDIDIDDLISKIKK